MIKDAVSLVDHLIKLLRVRKERRRRLFQEFIDPMYANAEKIAQDYMDMFNELIARLEAAEDFDDLIKWIEKRRAKFVPLRIKTRAFLVEFPELHYEKAKRGSAPPLLLFKRSIWGLMKGGLSLVSEGHSELQEYGWGQHTVLDILYRLPKRSPAFGKQAFARNRQGLIELAQGQRECVNQAWKDATIAYARLKNESLA